VKRKGLRTTTTADGRKAAEWSLIRRRPWIQRVLLLSDSSPAVEWPDKPLPLAQPGTIVFTGGTRSLDLADAREALPQHQDLWDAIQHEFWTTLFDH
jgi:hypothetical protein